MHGRMFSCIPGRYAQEAWSIPFLQVGTTKNVSRCCQLLTWGGGGLLVLGELSLGTPSPWFALGSHMRTVSTLLGIVFLYLLASGVVPAPTLPCMRSLHYSNPALLSRSQPRPATFGKSP